MTTSSTHTGKCLCLAPITVLWRTKTEQPERALLGHVAPPAVDRRTGDAPLARGDGQVLTIAGS
jgi:hypothetical protein